MASAFWVALSMALRRAATSLTKESQSALYSLPVRKSGITRSSISPISIS